MNARSAMLEPPAVTTTGKLLVVDDHASARSSMVEVLRQAGHQAAGVSSAVEALQHLEHETYDVVITDLQMPGMTGLELVRQLERRPHGAQIIMVTAHATVATAVEAMRHGAFDYLEKPFDVEQLEQVVNRALARGRLLDRRPAASDDVQGIMIGRSAAMRTLRAKIAEAAPTQETVLISGESGAGKELVARALHQGSARSKLPLVSVNSPGLSAHLLESELFGHERGAFTGADAPRTGRFELADRGTLLFDEITEIDLSLQAKLLRVLQERTFEKVGSNVTQHVDVRVLATTNRHLSEEVRAGRFRQDLYFRLAVLTIEVPPLRERSEDIPLLVDHFLGLASQRLGRPVVELSPGALDLMQSYSWPGNVRELGNLMTRAAVRCSHGMIQADDLRGWMEGASEGPTTAAVQLPQAPQGVVNLADMERKLIESTLEQFGGHREKTAKALGIGLRTLTGKLKQYGYAPRAKRFSAG